MTPTQLRYFVETVAAGSIRQAAERLYLSPTALSKALRVLERDVGTELLVRGSAGSELTPAGDVFLPEAKAILAAIDRARDQVSALSDEEEPLRIGTFDEGAAELTMSIIERYGAGSPTRRRPTFNALGYDQLRSSLLESSVDALIAAQATDVFEPTDAIRLAPLFAEPRLAVLPTTHPLAAADRLTTADLLDETFVNVSGFPEPLRRHFFLVAERGGHEPRYGPPIPVVSSFSDVLRAIAIGSGIATVSASSARYYVHPDVVYVPVADAAPTVVWMVGRIDDGRPGVDELLSAAATVAATGLDVVPTAEPVAEATVDLAGETFAVVTATDG